MRGLWLGVLLLATTAASAGPVQVVSTSTLFGNNDRDASPIYSSSATSQAPTFLRRPNGLDSLADRMGLKNGKLTFYEFTDRPGTDRAAHFQLGVGGKGLMFSVVW